MDGDATRQPPADDTPRGNRTPATGVKGPRADRYTMGARASESTRPGALLLARHGETAYNAEGRFQGLGPVPLNARGREQGRLLAEAAAGKGFVELWCSPLVRARETADIVAARIGLEPIEDERLVETDTGDWTDRTASRRSTAEGKRLCRLPARGSRLRLSRRGIAARPDDARARGARRHRTPADAGARRVPRDGHPPRVRRARRPDRDGRQRRAHRLLGRG